MKRHHVQKLIFSTSKTVYVEKEQVLIFEKCVRNACNHYGWTKSMVEQVLEDVHAFDPEGIPDNLMPYITQVAIGRRESLSVFGADYDALDKYFHRLGKCQSSGRLEVAVQSKHRDESFHRYNRESIFVPPSI